MAKQQATSCCTLLALPCMLTRQPGLCDLSGHGPNVLLITRRLTRLPWLPRLETRQNVCSGGCAGVLGLTLYACHSFRHSTLQSSSSCVHRQTDKQRQSYWSQRVVP
jgi:hypothetical protein